jgi:hypothetical protein
MKLLTAEYDGQELAFDICVTLFAIAQRLGSECNGSVILDQYSSESVEVSKRNFSADELDDLFKGCLMRLGPSVCCSVFQQIPQDYSTKNITTQKCVRCFQSNSYKDTNCVLHLSQIILSHTYQVLWLQLSTNLSISALYVDSTVSTPNRIAIPPFHVLRLIVTVTILMHFSLILFGSIIYVKVSM